MLCNKNYTHDFNKVIDTSKLMCQVLFRDVTRLESAFDVVSNYKFDYVDMLRKMNFSKQSFKSAIEFG